MKLFKTEEHPDVATIMSNIALIYSDMGQRQKALKINKRIYGIKKSFLHILIFFFLEIRKKIFNTEEHADIATTLNNMALIYYHLNDKKAARKNFTKALGTLKYSLVLK